MNALQQLIADYIEDNPRENLSSIGRRGGLPRQTVWSLANKPSAKQTPHPDTIKRLAKGMPGIPESVIRAAAGSAAGYESTSVEIGDEEELMMVESFRTLDDERKQVLRRRLRHLMAEMREEREAGAGE